MAPKAADSSASMFHRSCPRQPASVSQLTLHGYKPWPLSVVCIRLPIYICWSLTLLLAFASRHSLLQSPSDLWPRFLFSIKHVFQNEDASLMRRGSEFILRHYVHCTVVSAWIYPCCWLSDHLWTQHTLCHCTALLRNIYTRHTAGFFQCRLVQQVMPKLTLKLPNGHRPDCYQV